MSDTAQRFLDTLSDGRSGYGGTIYTIVDKNGDDVSLTRDVLRHWAALEAQADAVAELVRAARTVLSCEVADITEHDAEFVDDECNICLMLRALEPFAEVDR